MNPTIESFAQLELSPPILEALAGIGYETPSPIQAACIPHLRAGHDLLGEAQTGTGKTAAFALPLLDRLDLSARKPQVLVLTPTRELAIQVAEAFQRYAKNLPGFHVLPIYGGQSMVVQLRQLSRGAHVVVGTPGRVMDHIERESLNLDGLKTLVLDEADEMLRMGFIDDVEWILEHVPAERQTALFSATMPDAIRRVAHRYLREPREVKIKTATTTVTTIRQRFCQIAVAHKLDALTRILEVEEEFDAAIVFVRTKTATVELAEKLEARGYAAAALNGDMTQQLRERVIEQLKGGGLDIVVATDVAARGLDVPRISHVINYDIPYDTEAYVHRIGRTGRAGRTGSAILFVAPREMRMLKMIERATRQPIEALQLPSREAVADKRVTAFRQQVATVLESEDLDFFREVVTGMEDSHDADIHDIAAALAFLAQRERPLQLPRSAGPDIAAAQSAPRTERPPRENRDAILERRRDFSDGRLQRYRIEVGRNQQATPKDIVGAIANEAGIESRFIGQINLYEDYSTVELPGDLPHDVLDILRRVRVRQRQLNIRPLDHDEAQRDAARPRPGPGPRFGAKPAPRGEDAPRKSFAKPWDKPAGKPGGDRPQGGKPFPSERRETQGTGFKPGKKKPQRDR
ncbi:DEAD/DEAH box helicase [Aromatoleum toluolicum]|uniref:ATP-dependent RNA helicase DeaD n=1 Tax=Aromatoleum toluolicum TaxID=90060 RepID=A0ABX1NFE2_9RHOO|nr:DEAD/DEAH box helicase [Aromatoleum toluolicum]NMF98007.1 DEAD/DEAH box helicase [Aromatoleum toluolicum]